MTCYSGKIVFETKAEAKKAMRQIKKTNSGYNPKNVYQCSMCDKWHVTTQSKKHSRARFRITEQNRLTGV